MKIFEIDFQMKHNFKRIFCFWMNFDREKRQISTKKAFNKNAITEDF